jgi:hypothetical protein
MHNSFGTGPSTRLLVMCMLVEMPSLVPSPLSPQPAGSIKGGGGEGVSSGYFHSWAVLSTLDTMFVYHWHRWRCHWQLPALRPNTV